MKKSWRTTTLGVLAILGLLVVTASVAVTAGFFEVPP